jgi:hypothetical protein
MDPNATYDMLVDAILADDTDGAIEHARNLWNWLSKGGFAPDRPKINPVPMNIPGLRQFIIGINGRL